MFLPNLTTKKGINMRQLEYPRTRLYTALVAAMAVSLLIVLPDMLYAAQQVDTVITKFQDVLRDGTNVRNYLANAARQLFWILALIQIAWNLYQLILEGRFELQSFVLCVLKNIFLLVIMWFFLSNAESHFRLIINSFLNAGKALSGGGTMSELITLGTQTTTTLFHSIGEVQGSMIATLPAYIFSGICCIIIMLSFAMSVLTLIIGLCKLYLSALIAIYFVGFASLDYTRNIAITAYKSVYCSGVEVFVMYLLFGIAHDIFPTFFSDVQSMTVSDIIPLCCQLVVATFVFAGALKTLPQFASGIVAGSPLGGGIQAGSGAALAGAVAGGVATGIATVAGAGLGAVGGVKLAGAMGGGGWSKLGHGLAGVVKGGFGGEHGAVGNMMRQAGFNAVRRGLEKQHNNITPPGGNPNNVNP